MYVPYLYGRQFELQAVEKLAPHMISAASSGKQVVPLLEPVKLNSVWGKAIPKIAKTGLPFFMVMNPRVGKHAGKFKEVHDATFKGDPTSLSSAIPTYVVTTSTALSEITAFAGIYPGRDVAFLITNWLNNAAAFGAAISGLSNVREVLYMGSGANPAVKSQITPTSGVLIEDGFQRVQTNATYPRSSFFSALPMTYQGLGYTGFGDFLMVGEDYREGGGQAAAVALHLTELEPQANVLMMNHFVSHRTQGPGVDVAGKYLEALDQLASHVTGPPRKFAYSAACNDFLQNAQTRHFPGLAVPKEISMRHHIELMINEIL